MSSMSNRPQMSLFIASMGNNPQFPPPPSDPKINYFSMKSVFSDNSRAYYKKGSLSYGTVGSVRNSRHISKHT
jgi:hypothetical protein